MGNQPHAYDQHFSLASIGRTIVAGAACNGLLTLTEGADQLLIQSGGAYTPAEAHVTVLLLSRLVLRQLFLFLHIHTAGACMQLCTCLQRIVCCLRQPAGRSSCCLKH